MAIEKIFGNLKSLDLLNTACKAIVPFKNSANSSSKTFNLSTFAAK